MRTLLAALTALMLFATPVVAGDFEDALAAYDAGDYQKAFRLWEPLAEQGHAKAQFHLSLMYYKGAGVLRDFVTAYAWVNLAAYNGADNGSKGREMVARRMTPEQIAEAQKLSKELLKKIEANKKKKD